MSSLSGSFKYFALSCPQMAYVVAEKYVQPSDVCKSFGVCFRPDGVGQSAVTNCEHDSHLKLLATIHNVTKSSPERRRPYHDRQWGAHTGHTVCSKKALKERGAGANSPLQGTASSQFQDDGPLKILQLTDIHLDVFYQEVANDWLLLALQHYMHIDTLLLFKGSKQLVSSFLSSGCCN